MSDEFLGLWVAGDERREGVVEVIEVLPFGALVKVKYSTGWQWSVVTSEQLARWQWRRIDAAEAEAWPQWKLGQ